MVKSKVPSVLNERLLIDDNDRELLQSIDFISPKDNSGIFVTPSIFNRGVPTLKQIADNTGKTKEEVWSQLDKIRRVWGVPAPDKLPTANGFFDKEDALVNALVNQHRTRWNENRQDYNVTKIHMMSGEMGLGQLYTNNRAFTGEKILRQAMGVDENLNSVHFQGGIMPEFIQIFGKAKNQRALMTGLSESEGKDNKADEFEKIKQILEVSDYELSDRDMANLERYVVNTIGSLEEAADTSAHELLPLVKNVPGHVPIHFYYGPNDRANMSEIEDTLIESLRKIHQKMKHSTENLPKWEDDKAKAVYEMNSSLVEKLFTERVYSYVSDQLSRMGEDTPEKGEEFRGIVNSFFRTKKGGVTKKFGDTKEKVKKNFYELSGVSPDVVSEQQFESDFYAAVNKIIRAYTTSGKFDSAVEKQRESFRKLNGKIANLEDKINEGRRFENALMVEGSGPAWFTKRIAITPTEAKMIQMIKKEDYKNIYENILIPRLQELSGRELNVRLHTDSIITVNVPDLEDLVRGNYGNPDDQIGTLITSFPQTNEQRSNEPLNNSAADLQSFHEGEVSERVKKGKSKPKKLSEFNKRDFGSSDIYMTSYGADGFSYQPRFTVGPTTVKGEFRLQPEISQYVKLTTRHDTSELGRLMVSGNRGTWTGKRVAKGGNTTGNTFIMEHADGSLHPVFIDDAYHEAIAEEFGEKYNELEKRLDDAEAKLAKSKSPEMKTRYKTSIKNAREGMNKILEEVRPIVYKIFLENDLHLGQYTNPGRPSTVDGVSASQIFAAQTYGIDGFSLGIITEAMNGEQAWKDYDSKREGGQGSKRTNVEIMRDIDFIRQKMLESGFSEKKVGEYLREYTKQFLNSKPEFLPEEQIKLFEQVEVPLNSELMNGGMQLYIGSGNHWQASGRGKAISEGDVEANLFDSRYEDQGLLIRGKEATGQGYSYETVGIPGVNGTIPAVITHKLPSGRTELSDIAKHLVKTRTPAYYAFVADRHHGGMIAEKGKMAVLDMGKSPVVPYVDMIGKVSSLRGTVVAEYGADGELMIGSRYFVDPVVDKVTGWNYRAGILDTCNSMLEAAKLDSSIYRTTKRDEQLRKLNRGKADRVMAKYDKKD